MGSMVTAMRSHPRALPTPRPQRPKIPTLANSHSDFHRNAAASIQSNLLLMIWRVASCCPNVRLVEGSRVFTSMTAAETSRHPCKARSGVLSRSQSINLYPSCMRRRAISQSYRPTSVSWTEFNSRPLPRAGQGGHIWLR